jgi:hypothetical protein
MEFRSSVPRPGSFIPENYCLSQVLHNRKKNLELYKLMEVSSRPPPFVSVLLLSRSDIMQLIPTVLRLQVPELRRRSLLGELWVPSFRQTAIHRHLRLQANQITRIYDMIGRISRLISDKFGPISPDARNTAGRPAFGASAFLQLKWYFSTEIHISRCAQLLSHCCGLA